MEEFIAYDEQERVGRIAVGNSFENKNNYCAEFQSVAAEGVFGLRLLFGNHHACRYPVGFGSLCPNCDSTLAMPGCNERMFELLHLLAPGLEEIRLATETPDVPVVFRSLRPACSRDGSSVFARIVKSQDGRRPEQ